MTHKGQFPRWGVMWVLGELIAGVAGVRCVARGTVTCQPVGAVGRTLGLTHSGAVRLSDRLEAAGLVRRTSAGPGRTLALHLTGAGRLAAAQVLARRQDAVEQLVRQLDPGEAALLERLAGNLLAALTTDRASARHLCRLCDEPLCASSTGCPVVQRAVPAASSTEAFAWTFAVITVAMAAGSAFGGVIIQGAGAKAAFLSAGGLGLAGAAFGAFRLAAHRPGQAAQRS